VAASDGAGRRRGRRPRKASPGEDSPLHGFGAGSAALLLAAAAVVSAFAAANTVGFARLTGSPVWALLGGGAAAVLASIILAFLLRRRERRLAPTAVGSLVRHPIAGPIVLSACAAVLSISWLYPGSGRVDPEPVAGLQWVHRPDGSRLALHVSRGAAATRPPVIVVHGGPGVADMAHDAAAFAALATDRDVYVYDRVGTGASTRLADPTGYTTARAVQDLEAVRADTGADRVVLLGHSWGARFAVAYLQQHRDHVAALVLSAPGELPLDGRQPPPGNLTSRLDTGEKARLYGRLAGPRNLFTYALTAADPGVAHAIAGDREMDRRFAGIYRASTPALFCDEHQTGKVGTTGVGYYAHYVPQLHPDPTDIPLRSSELSTTTVPVLLIKPACDYLPWPTAGYRTAFPRMQLIMLPDAGHAAYLEQPRLYFDVVRAFLAGEPLPLPTIDGNAIPATYRGTR
jgi:proline iminopeptidase